MDGVELAPRTIRHVRDRIGILFEDPDDQLFGPTVGEDLAYEPDPRGRRELAELLATLPATMVIASHDLEFLRGLCSRALIVDRGVVAAEGSVETVLADRELLLRHGLA